MWKTQWQWPQVLSPWSITRRAAKRSDSRSSCLKAHGRISVGRDILDTFKTLNSYSSPPTRLSCSTCCRLRCEGNEGEKTRIIKRNSERQFYDHATFKFCFKVSQDQILYDCLIAIVPNHCCVQTSIQQNRGAVIIHNHLNQDHKYTTVLIF